MVTTSHATGLEKTLYDGLIFICDPLPPNEALVGNSEIEVLIQCDRGAHWLQNGERIMFLS